ncbi:MAG: helix-hairpin-helix domain-containing protein [Clostridia bacterium]|nr:helix-hairpin-helix domain-containing protein [Clostridia bacterium]
MRFLSGKLPSFLKAARRIPTARFFFFSCFFLCAGLFLFQGAEYCLSLRREAVSVSAQPADVRRLSPADSADEQRIDINSASLDDLTRVSGIGPVIARNILSYRDSLGGFHFLEEVLDVSGVGRKRFEALRELFYCPAP